MTLKNFEVVAGNPAEHIRYRFDEGSRNEIRNKDWTTMSIDEIKEEWDFFNKKFT
ncbi:MAG: hypothetical protein ABEJ95_00415 [Candidatus Nanohalobium sp.]